MRSFYPPRFNTIKRNASFARIPKNKREKVRNKIYFGTPIILTGLARYIIKNAPGET